MYRRLLGAKLYVLVGLLPLATLSESLGITLLLPLLASLDGGDTLTGQRSGPIGRVIDWLPLPTTPLGLLALIAGIFVMKAVMRFVTDAVSGYFQAKLLRELKTTLIDGYTNLDYLAFSRRNTGHYVNVINTQTNRVSGTFVSISQFFMQGAAAIVYLGMAALVNWRFAVIASVAGLVFIFAMRQLSVYVRRLSRHMVEEYSALNTKLVQVLHAMKYLQATDRTRDMGDQLHGSCHRLFHHQVRANLARAFTSAIREPLSVILVLGLIAMQIAYFSQPVGSIFVALLLLHRATQAIFGIQGSWQQAMEYIGSAEAVQEDYQYTTDHREQRTDQSVAPFHDVVEFRDVSFAYDPRDGEVLRSIDMRIPRNQTVALVGHSGAGKSTLADLLTLLLRPQQGAILLDGRNAAEIDPYTWRRQLGYVCQETVVFDETVAANICLSPSEYTSNPDCRRRVHEAARQAFASSFIESLPNGYDTIVGDRGVRLSGGQRQRLFIARELYKQPRLLILDEATSALDGESEQAIQQSIEALHGEVTVVVIAHRLATIKNADYIYVLDIGEVVEEGAYTDLHSDADSRFRRMVELQAL